jgi:hypothetical protein
MRASEYRKRTERTTEVELPSGAVFTLRRPPLLAWVNAGKIPQSFLRAAVAADRNPDSIASLPDEEILAAMKFTGEAIRYACVNPRIVDGGTGDDELDPSEIAPEDFEFLANWIGQNAPGVPVETKGGETSTEALGRFPRQKKPGGGFVDAGTDGGEVRPATEPDVGVDG